MEKEKSKNVIIVILSLVILVLAILLTLIFTGVISLNGKNTPVENTATENTDNTPLVTITMEEAKNKVKDVISNKKWMDYGCTVYTNPGKTGKEAVNQLTSKDFGFSGDEQLYDQSTYKSYEEFYNHLRETFTVNFIEYWGKNIDHTLQKEFYGTDGTKYYNYAEKNGYLYCRNGMRGGDNNHEKYLDKTTYDVTDYNDNIIRANVKAYWLNVSNEEYVENVIVTLVYENGIWKLDGFNITSTK